MALSLTTADAALREDYLPPLREQLNNANVLDREVQKNTEDIEGRRAVLSLHVSRNSGVGSRAENGTLPTAGNQGYAEQRVPVYYHYGRIQVSGPVIKAMKSDKGSFARAIDSEMKGIKQDAARDYNRQRWGTSNGVIATCGTTSSSTTVTLLSAGLNQLRQLEVGSLVDIGTVASPTTVASARSVVSVDRSAGTFVISGAAVSTTSGTHFIFRSGAGGDTANSSQKELTGLQTIVAASGTLFNVNPTTYPVWAARVDSNSGTNRAPTDTLFEESLQEIEIESGVAPNLIITTAGVERAYSASLKSQKRFTDTVDLKGGFKALSVSAGNTQAALTYDRDCPANEAYILNTEHLIDFIEADWQFMEEDGAILSRVANTDAYEATLYKYAEQATDRRAAHGKIVDLTEA